jgi:hypothetical protein
MRIASRIGAHLYGTISKQDLRNASIIALCSVILHLAYFAWSIPPASPTSGHIDLWGDGIHFWLLSYLTAKHGFVYQDLKPIGLQIIWLPLHPLITAATMWLTGNYSLQVIHALNVIYGTLVALGCYGVARVVYPKRVHWAFAAGLGLVFNAWWIAFSSEGIVEPLLTLTVISMVYYWAKADMLKMAVFVFIAAFTKYEAWFMIAVLFVISLYQRRFNRRTFAAYIFAAAIPVALWSFWSWAVAGNAFAWYGEQVNWLAWDVSFLPKIPSLVAWSIYPSLIIAMTTGLFGLGVVIGVKRGGLTKWLALLSLTYLAFRSWGLAAGFTIANERFVALLIPFAYVLSVPALPKSLSKPKSRKIYCAGLLLLLLVPLASQIWVFQKIAYVNYPQVRAGLWLKDHYTGGTVVCDLPTVLGYAYPNPNPEDFLSTAIVHDGFVSHHSSLTWLYQYVKSHGITYFVWNYVSYSASWQFDHGRGSMTNLGSGNSSYFFKLVYADTERNHWEHAYGVPNLYIYQIDYQRDWLQNGNLPN